MTPYKVLYGRKCRFHLCWEIGARQWTGPELMQITLEKVFIIQQRLKTVFFYIDRKAMWTLRRKNVSFSSGDLVSLKVSPIKELMRLGKREKLAPSYLGPFEIRSRVGEVAYRLVLPP